MNKFITITDMQNIFFSERYTKTNGIILSLFFCKMEDGRSILISVYRFNEINIYDQFSVRYAH